MAHINSGWKSQVAPVGNDVRCPFPPTIQPFPSQQPHNVPTSITWQPPMTMRQPCPKIPHQQYVFPPPGSSPIKYDLSVKQPLYVPPYPPPSTNVPLFVAHHVPPAPEGNWGSSWTNLIPLQGTAANSNTGIPSIPINNSACSDKNCFIQQQSLPSSCLSNVKQRRMYENECEDDVGRTYGERARGDKLNYSKNMYSDDHYKEKVWNKSSRGSETYRSGSSQIESPLNRLSCSYDDEGRNSKKYKYSSSNSRRPYSQSPNLQYEFHRKSPRSPDSNSWNRKSRSPSSRRRQRRRHSRSPSSCRRMKPSRSPNRKYSSRSDCRDSDYKSGKSASQSARRSKSSDRSKPVSFSHSQSHVSDEIAVLQKCDMKETGSSMSNHPCSYDNVESRKKNSGGDRCISPTANILHLKCDNVDTSGSSNDSKDNSKISQRDLLLRKWRENYCSNTKDMHKKLDELAKMKPEEILEDEKKVWTRSAPADLYYVRDENCPKLMRCTPKLSVLCDRFMNELVNRAAKVESSRPKYEPPPRKNRTKLAKHKSDICNSNSFSSGDSSCEEDDDDEEDCIMEELERKRMHPYRLHPEMWYNDSGEMNDGPLCRCSARARRNGMRHECD